MHSKVNYCDKQYYSACKTFLHHFPSNDFVEIIRAWHIPYCKWMHRIILVSMDASMVASRIHKFSSDQIVSNSVWRSAWAGHISPRPRCDFFADLYAIAVSLTSGASWWELRTIEAQRICSATHVSQALEVWSICSTFNNELFSAHRQSLHGLLMSWLLCAPMSG